MLCKAASKALVTMMKNSTESEKNHWVRLSPTKITESDRVQVHNPVQNFSNSFFMVSFIWWSASVLSLLESTTACVKFSNIAIFLSSTSFNSFTITDNVSLLRFLLLPFDRCGVASVAVSKSSSDSGGSSPTAAVATVSALSTTLTCHRRIFSIQLMHLFEKFPGYTASPCLIDIVNNIAICGLQIPQLLFYKNPRHSVPLIQHWLCNSLPRSFFVFRRIVQVVLEILTQTQKQHCLLPCPVCGRVACWVRWRSFVICWSRRRWHCARWAWHAGCRCTLVHTTNDTSRCIGCWTTTPVHHPTNNIKYIKYSIQVWVNISPSCF